MQGVFSPELIRKILFAGIIEGKTQRAIAIELCVTLKTVNRYLKVAKEKNITAENIKKMDINKLAKKIEVRFDGKKLKRRKSIEKYISKTLLKEAAQKITKGYSYNSCYRDYIEASAINCKEHYSKDYYRLILREYILKEFEKNFKVSEIWNIEDVLYLSLLVGVKFTKVMKTVLYSKNKSECEAVKQCMRLINFISGDRNIYEFINEKLEVKELSFKELWSEIILYRNVNVGYQKKWDENFFCYKERIIADFKRKELNKLYKGKL